LAVEPLGKQFGLRVKLYDLALNKEPVTAWISLVSPELLRVGRNAKPVREALKREHPQTWERVLEKVIQEIQDNEAEWQGEDNSNEENTAGIQLKPSILKFVEKEVEDILNAENMLEALSSHLDNVLPGERENKLAIFTLLHACKFSDIRLKAQLVILKGNPGGGKSTLMRELADPFKVKDVGRFTAHALDYTNLEGYEILRLKEIGDLDEEKHGLSTLKFLSADDQGYTVEVTVRDPETGEHTTKQYRIPPITVISSTTRVQLDPQFQRRVWTFNVDESREQTARVLKWKAERERQKDETALGIRETTDYDFSRAVLRRLAEKFEPCRVIVPFPESLAEVLNPEVLRVRGDYDKILAFVKIYGSFNRKRLLKLSQSEAYILTPEVCVEALKLIWKPLVAMTVNLEERTLKLLEKLEELGITEEGDEISRETREKLAVKLGRSEKTVRAYLAQLEAAGYFSSDQKRPKTFKLLYSLEAIKAKTSGILAILESAEILMEKMRKETQKWLKTISETLPPENPLIFSQEKTVFQHETRSAKVKKINISREEGVSEISRRPEKDSFPEKTAEYWQNRKLPIISKDSPFRISEVESVRRMDPPDYGKCWYCGNVAALTFAVTLFDGSWGLVCEECGQLLTRQLRKRDSEAKAVPEPEKQQATSAWKSQVVACPECGAEGRRLYFANKRDLQMHLSRFHGERRGVEAD